MPTLLSFAVPALVLCGLIPAAATDIRRREIPDLCLIPVLGAALLNLFLVFGRWERLAALCTTAVFLILFAYLSAADPDGLGGGDMKLILCLIPACGAPLAASALLIGLLVALAAGRLKKMTHLPLAPFLLTGYAICWIFSFLPLLKQVVPK